MVCQLHICLSNLEFDHIEIQYTALGEQECRTVEAKRDDGSVVIQVDDVKGTLEIPVVRRPDIRRFISDPPIRMVEEAVEFFARYMEDVQDNEVLRFLGQLPGPLYLPLDRRWDEDTDSSVRMRTRRSTTAGHMPISSVLSLAERAFRQELSDKSKRDEALRAEMITSLFLSDTPYELPRVWTTGELRERRDRVVTALSNLGLEEARRLSEEHFSSLEPIAGKLGGQPSSEFTAEGPNSDSWIDWFVQGLPIATRIERLIPLFEQYESDWNKITQKSTGFLESVNEFIGDNGKKLIFSRGAELSVELPTGQTISGQHLSSGELQLLILFTFLYFRFEDPHQEFPVLVDEPELSLHIAWQNRYVKSIREANPNAQFIIATHSPEIASHDEDTILDITPTVSGHASVQ